MWHTSIYCKTLDNVSREEAVNTVHQLLTQLTAARDRDDLPLDHTPAIEAGKALLTKAGHPGYNET